MQLPNNEKIQFFLKFGEQQYMERLLNSGEIFCKPLEDFKALSGDIERYDPAEGRLSIKNIGETVLEFSPVETINYKKLLVQDMKMERFLPIVNYNSYSLFQITTETAIKSQRFEIPNEMFTFGDSFVVITRPKVFVDRIRSAVLSSGYTLESGSVKYYNPNDDCENLGVFYKSIDFKHQNEYRILIETGLRRPLSLSIGSIEDIAVQYDKAQCRGFVFKWPDT